MKNTAIVWFRNDLRVHDNESLYQAMEHAENVIPVYVFDDRVFKSKTAFGYKKTGIYRAQFILEAVLNLKESLSDIGLDLVVRCGITEDILFELATKHRISWIYCNRERTQEEVDVQDALEAKLWTRGQEVRYNRGKMLYHTADLPFPITHTPDTFTSFRKEVEKIVEIRDPLPPVKNYEGQHIDEDSFFPDLEYFGFDSIETDQLSGLRFSGGETAGLQRLDYYFFDSDLIGSYKKTRNGLLGDDYSSKFSPYLAQGCLSPKMIYYKLKEYEKKVASNNSTYWMFFELLWRDFFRLMGKKYGNKIFQIGGTKQDIKKWNEDRSIFDKWASGSTGIPFVDANMRELNQTGFMSNRGRQVTASFLIHDLGINWLMGAEYFESLLIDYDPCSNYGNWNYLAGVGSDPRENRVFNITSQMRKYDPQGTYIKKMIPELSDFTFEELVRPDLVSGKGTRSEVLGVVYPEVVVDDWHR